MVLLHYNSETNEMNVVSIPRDTLIKINGKNIKINSAHAIGGVEYAVDAVEKLLNIDIDYYGKVNYEGFRKLIDSVGGVEMEIERNMNYDDPSQNLHIHFKKGETVHLDGEKAEQFFRWRKNNNGTGLADGDLGRIENQHIFMSKLLEKLKSPWIIPRIPAVFMTLPKYCETNMSADEIIKYGFYFIRADGVSMETLKGDSQYLKGISYFVYDKSSNKEILDKIQDRNTSFTEENINKKQIKIQVLNGTNKSGLASSYKKYLQSKGYNNVNIGNASPAKKSTILLQDNFDVKQQNYIKTDFGINTMKNTDDNSNGFDIIVMLGEDKKYFK
jgi:LCP family protein required for cell wall assembly